MRGKAMVFVKQIQGTVTVRLALIINAESTQESHRKFNVNLYS